MGDEGIDENNSGIASRSEIGDDDENNLEIANEPVINR